MRQAYEVVRNIEPTSPQEFIIKAVTCACLGQEINSEDLLQQAQHLFQVIGSSATECDTTPGRQCMASFFFLNKQFEDAIMYLKLRNTLFSPKIYNYESTHNTIHNLMTL